MAGEPERPVRPARIIETNDASDGIDAIEAVGKPAFDTKLVLRRLSTDVAALAMVGTTHHATGRQALCQTLRPSQRSALTRHAPAGQADPTPRPPDRGW